MTLVPSVDLSRNHKNIMNHGNFQFDKTGNSPHVLAIKPHHSFEFSLKIQLYTSQVVNSAK